MLIAGPVEGFQDRGPVLFKAEGIHPLDARQRVEVRGVGAGDGPEDGVGGDDLDFDLAGLGAAPAPGAQALVAVLDFGRRRAGRAAAPLRAVASAGAWARDRFGRQPLLHRFQHLRAHLLQRAQRSSGDAKQLLLALRLPPRRLGEEEVREHLERGPVQIARPPVAQQIQLAEHGAAAAVQGPRRLHPLPSFRIEFARAWLLRDQAREFGLRLGEQLPRTELLAELLPQRQQVADVGERILELLGRERPLSPVAALLVDGELHSELIAEQVVQAHPFDPERLRCGVGIENAAEGESVITFHAEHVVLGGVQDAFARPIGEQRQERRDPEREGVDRPVRLRSRDLQKADLLVVSVKPVALRVEPDPGAVRHVFHAGGQLSRAVDELLEAIHDGWLYHALPRC